MFETVEFGLIRTTGGLRIFGAGILSSVAESAFALESPSPNRIAFDVQRVMRTKYAVDDFQQTYFVIVSKRAGLWWSWLADLGREEVVMWSPVAIAALPGERHRPSGR